MKKFLNWLFRDYGIIYFLVFLLQVSILVILILLSGRFNPDTTDYNNVSVANTINLSQVNSVENLASPDLTGKEYLGNGVYRIYNGNGLTFDYNVYSGNFILNGTALETSVLYEYHSAENYDNLTMSFVYNSGETLNNGSNGLSMIINFDRVFEIRKYVSNQTQNDNRTYSVSQGGRYNSIAIYEGASFDNYTFKLQIEQGTTATDYKVPLQPYLWHEQQDYNNNGSNMEWVNDEYPKEWPLQHYLISNQYKYDIDNALMFDNNKKLYDKSFALTQNYYDNHVTNVRANNYNQYSVVVEVSINVTANEKYVLYFNNFNENDTSITTLEHNVGGDPLDLYFKGVELSNNYDNGYNSLILNNNNNSVYGFGIADNSGELRLSFIFSGDNMPSSHDIEIMDQQNYNSDLLLNTVYERFGVRIYRETDTYNSFLNDVAGGLLNYGYSYGYRFGYQVGLIDGGANQDYQDGYIDGWNDSILENKDHWINTGALQGYQDGYAVGYQDGYDIGYPEGQASEFGFSTLLSTVFVGLGSFLNIKILPNISIGAVIAVPIVFGIIYFIIGRRKGD